jgi:hypothetical protein
MAFVGCIAGYIRTSTWIAIAASSITLFANGAGVAIVACQVIHRTWITFAYQSLALFLTYIGACAIIAIITGLASRRATAQ